MQKLAGFNFENQTSDDDGYYRAAFNCVWQRLAEETRIPIQRSLRRIVLHKDPQVGGARCWGYVKPLQNQETMLFLATCNPELKQTIAHELRHVWQIACGWLEHWDCVASKLPQEMQFAGLTDILERDAESFAHKLYPTDFGFLRAYVPDKPEMIRLKHAWNALQQEEQERVCNYAEQILRGEA